MNLAAIGGREPGSANRPRMRDAGALGLGLAGHEESWSMLATLREKSRSSRGCGWIQLANSRNGPGRADKVHQSSDKHSHHAQHLRALALTTPPRARHIDAR